MKSQNGNKLILFAAAAAIIVCYIGSTISQYFSPAIGVDAELVKMANEINKNMPMMSDRETRIDNVSAAPDKTVIYQVTLINAIASEVSKDAIIAQMRPRIVMSYRTDPHKHSFEKMELLYNAYCPIRVTFILPTFQLAPKTCNSDHHDF